AFKWQLNSEKHFKKIFVEIIKESELGWFSGFLGGEKGAEGRLVWFFLGTSMCYGQIMSLRS
ncbi:hypothetical protein KIL84_011729, partial [Mauremys mutica]